MAEGESPAVARRRLRLALRQARQAKGFTQRQVAVSLDWSLSKVNRIEAGEVTVSGTDLQALLRLFDITDPDRTAQLTGDARAARRRGWWDQPEYREHLTPAMIQSLQFESEATAIRSFQPTLIPGLLQTPAYASAIIDLWSDQLPAADQAIRAEVRSRRRDHLFSRAEPPTYQLLVDESVLLREVGGAPVMAEQLYRLLEFSRSGRIALRVTPLAHSAAYTFGAFTIYASEDEDLALYRESHLADEVVFTAESVARHRRMFDQMWGQSLAEEPAARLVEARAAAMRSRVDRQPPEG